MKVIVFLFALLTLCFCDGYKILVVFPFPGKSHSILGDGYVRYLLEAGHEVTYITPYPKKNLHRNLRQVIVRNDTFPGIDIRLIMDNKIDLSEPVLITLLMHDVAKATLANENVQRLMSDPAQKFDVAIVEWLFSELYSGFSAVFQCPFIWSGSTEPHPYILSLIDETYNPAYVPDIISIRLPPLSFMGRLKELYIQIMNGVVRKFYMNPEEDYKQLIGSILMKKGRVLPPYDEVKYNASLILGNSHVSMGQATTLPQSFKSIGGYHIDINTPPLPEDLERLMNKSTNGVIYFSLGTNLNSKDLPDEVKTSLLNMFGGLKQTVLWKFEEIMPNLPNNVHLVSWAPQLRVLVSLFHMINYGESYKILIIYPAPIKSLNILGQAQARLLLDAGHEVTYATVFPSKNKHRNYREIDLSDNVKVMIESREKQDFFNFDYLMKNGPPSSDVLFFQNFGTDIARMTFHNDELKKFLANNDEQFDLVVADLYECEAYAGFSALFNCPMIWTYSMGAHWQVLRLIDEATNPAYTSNYLSGNTPPLTFVQRIEELWTQIKWTYYKWFHTMPLEEEMYKKFFGPLIQKRGRELPSYQELIYNASIVLSNAYNYGGNMPATPQSFKMVGGFHIGITTEPLPKDLQYIMDNSKNGVIYFSMGSTWQSKYIPKPITEELLKMFGGLKQTVIWKYEDDDLKNIPKNVHIIKWAPQRSIMNHPNCLLFVTHGGQLSSTEAVHFGVPIIGIPIYFDQFVNIKNAVSLGYALKVEWTYDLAKTLRSAIDTMTANPEYRQRAKELSWIYHDRAVAPGAELVHWVQHAVRTRGAAHLRSPALTTPLYQKMYLDLIVLVLVISIVFIKLTKKFIPKSIKMIAKRSSKKEKLK